MKGGRLFWHSVLISLPAFAFTGLAVYFIFDKAPKLVAQQRRDENAAYRKIAGELAERPDEAEFSGFREKGWRRQSSRISPKGGGQVAWGHVRRGDKELVWIGNGKYVFGREVEPVDAIDLEILFRYGVPTAAFLVLLLTAMCLRFFIRYARDRDDFVAATVHDLTTPLVALRRTMGRDGEEAARVLERLERIVGNLKAFLRAGGRRAAPATEVFDLGEAYDFAYSMFREDFRDMFDGDDVGVAREGDLRVVADRRMAEQAIWNLLGNALKYAAPYGRVGVRIFREGGFVRLAVSDEGKGLSPRERRRVFDRYYRARGAVASGAGGFGVGLCISREALRDMGGDLTVRANIPKGCVFEMKLPAAPAPGCRVRRTERRPCRPSQC